MVIHAGKYFDRAKLFQSGRNQRERIRIFYCDLIQSSVVDARPEALGYLVVLVIRNEMD